MSTISYFKDIENKRDVFRGKNYMKKFCESFTLSGQRFLLNLMSGGGVGIPKNTLISVMNGKRDINV